jgi:polyhydroxyalkanoate synthesis regulator phasin
VIDIVKDYTAIGLGSVQATATRFAGLGRDGVELVSGDAGSSLRTLLDPRSRIACARDTVGSVLAGDVETVISKVGLAKRSELNAVRAQLQRIERILADTRGDR